MKTTVLENLQDNWKEEERCTENRREAYKYKGLEHKQELKGHVQERESEQILRDTALPLKIFKLTKTHVLTMLKF